MKFTRRQALGLMAGAIPAIGLRGATQDFSPQSDPASRMPPGIDPGDGPFKGTRESLETYQVPEWFRDAKFGMWAHWGPQSAVEFGDWYARNLYIQDSPQNQFHVATYGHPSKFGHKDLCRTWKGDQFDADHLIQLYKKAGAKYFMSMGVHHDNFDLWNSKHQPRWNAVATGPKKDVVGLFAKAA